MVDSCCDDIDTCSAVHREEMKMGVIIDAVLVFAIMETLAIHGDLEGASFEDLSIIIIAAAILVLLVKAVVRPVIAMRGWD